MSEILVYKENCGILPGNFRAVGDPTVIPGNWPIAVSRELMSKWFWKMRSVTVEATSGAYTATISTTIVDGRPFVPDVTRVDDFSADAYTITPQTYQVIPPGVTTMAQRIVLSGKPVTPTFPLGLPSDPAPDPGYMLTQTITFNGGTPSTNSSLTGNIVPSMTLFYDDASWRRDNLLRGGEGVSDILVTPDGKYWPAFGVGFNFGAFDASTLLPSITPPAPGSSASGRIGSVSFEGMSFALYAATGDITPQDRPTGPTGGSYITSGTSTCSLNVTLTPTYDP